MKKEAVCATKHAKTFSSPSKEDVIQIQDRAYVLLGVFCAPWGLSGEICVKTYTEAPEDLTRYAVLDAEGRPYVFLKVVQRGDKQIARVEGVQDRSEAERLRGRKLYAPRASFDAPGADQFFYADLIGLNVEDLVGAQRGVVIAVHNFCAGDILEIRLCDGEEIMIPFTRNVATQVDLARGLIVVDAQRAGF